MVRCPDGCKIIPVIFDFVVIIDTYSDFWLLERIDELRQYLNMSDSKVVLITGANAGIGLALAQRIIKEDASVHLVLACRNMSKADQAKELLLRECPGLSLDIVLLDTSDLQSVYKAAKLIRSRHRKLDYVYLNAGIMPVSNVNWKALRDGFFSTKVIHMFTTGDGLLLQVDGTTSDGVQKVFATNLFGHFVLIRELEEILGSEGCPSQIIWTSSSNAKPEAFSMNDFQHKHGSEPYSSSKYASDMISVALNEKYNKKNVYSHTTCPGLVMTNLTYGILPNWFWTLVFPFLWLLRLFTQTITVTPYNAAEVLIWLFKQQPQTLDPLVKYHSQISIIGRRYVKSNKMRIDPKMALQLCAKLEKLEEYYRPLCKS